MPTTTGILYHRPATPVRGPSIMPLNRLHDAYPQLWHTHRRKYDHGPHGLNQPVPPLDCAWGDVIFLSPVHPEPLFAALRRSGRPTPHKDPWTLDAGLLDPARTVIRLMRAGAGGHYPDQADADDYLPYTTASLRAVNRITVNAIHRLESLHENDPWLPWVDVPHVLFRGDIPAAWFDKPPE